jgi:hypothetical protein
VAIKVMKTSTTALVGLLVGAAIGIIGFGRVNNVNPQVANMASQIHPYLFWIVLLSLLVPLADYVLVSTNLPTTVLGFIARQPFRHLAAFFTGIAFGLLALILVLPQVIV